VEETRDKKRRRSFLVCVYCFGVGFENLEDAARDYPKKVSFPFSLLFFY
jgi:hypothetical protein